MKTLAPMVVVGTRVEPAIAARLEQLAREDDRTVSSLVRRAIAEHLREHEQQVRP